MTTKGTTMTPDKKARKAIFDLYRALDDIDTADDMAKDNDELYRSLVRKAHAVRFDVLDSAQVYELYDEFYEPDPGMEGVMRYNGDPKKGVLSE